MNYIQFNMSKNLFAFSKRLDFHNKPTDREDMDFV